MSHSRVAGWVSRKRIATAFLVTAVLSLASPLVAVSSASNAGGVGRSVSATFGDCKNDNSGLHNGYVCPILSIE